MFTTTYTDLQERQRRAKAFFKAFPQNPHQRERDQLKTPVIIDYNEKFQPVIYPWEEPRIDTTPYMRFLREIKNVLPEDGHLSHEPLYQTWTHSPGFQQIWWKYRNRDFGIFEQKDFEYSLCCRLFGRGADRETAWWTLKAWWKKHDIKKQSSTEFEKAWDKTAEPRAEFAANQERKKAERKHQKFNASRMKVVLECFSDVPSSAALAAKALNVERNILKVYVSRLAKAGLLTRTSRGMYVRTVAAEAGTAK